VAQSVGRGIALLFHDRGTRRGVSGQQHAPAALYLWERPGTHFTGGWVGPRAGLDGQKLSSPPGFDPGLSSPFSRLSKKLTEGRVHLQSVALCSDRQRNRWIEKNDSFRFLWPCIVNIRWRERTNKMQIIRCLLSKFLSQHISGIITPIIRRIRLCPTACGVLPGFVGCGWVLSCGDASWAVCTVWKLLFEQ